MRRRSLILGALLLVACKPRDENKLRVFAAASLTDALPPVATAWSSAKGGMPVELVFDATSRLAAQIEAGAPADVFVSADREWMDTLAEKDLVVADTRHDLLGNRLVVVVPADAVNAPVDVPGLRLVGRLALAGASVPAGKYARASLASQGLLADVEPRIVEGDNVRTALAWVAHGEADAAIVYATDAMIEPEVRVAFELAPESHPPIVYPIAAIAKREHLGAAEAFVDYARSEPAQAVFRDAGFAPPP
ncbi:MAG TPA: molybdate ABC transporter substrate-binding protein [Nannocystaceae bacterium]|nr:molybdate ABC transporter substrate-binding protein [Nannocystaceae bacterium]